MRSPEPATVEPALGGLTLDEIETALAERHLIDFIRVAWPVVEPGTRFVPGRHIEAIALHLEAVTRRQIRNLLINIPPRFAKSLIVSVFWPAWVWVSKPETRWLYTSYSQSLSTRDSVRTRRIIESPWFQERWGDRFQLTTDQNTKTRYENDRAGYRIATSVGGAATGEGGDFVVVDDPHNVQEGESEAVTAATCQWWDEVMSTRLNDPKTGCKVVIMQRVSEKDLSGHVMAKGDYEHLCLPMEYEAERHCRTSIGWEDWRRREGELLWPDRMGQPELAQLKKALGAYGTAGQLQQRPAPRGGGMFRRHWFGFVGAAPAGRGAWVRYWDRAGTKDGGDWTVGLLMLRQDGIFYVVDVVRFQGTDMEVIRAIQNTAARDGKRVQIRLEQDPGQAGLAEVQNIIRQLAGYMVRPVRADRAKELRARPAADQAEAGNVKLVVGPWNDAFLDELQTQAILAYQRKRQTLAGLADTTAQEPILQKHHDFQRILKPLAVVNPYADQLTYGDNRLQGRRDQPKYLGLIKAVALLRQLQKPVRTWGVNGLARAYIEVDKEDIRLANELTTELLGQTLDELSRPGYDLLMNLEKFTAAAANGEPPEAAKRKNGFTRRQIREATGWSQARVHRYLQEVIELEYVLVESGRNGMLQTYRLLYDGQGKDGQKFVLGLKPVEDLRDPATTPQS